MSRIDPNGLEQKPSLITATYDDSDNKATFYQYDKRGHSRVLFEMDATNNQKDRQYPTGSGKASGEPMLTMPPDGSTPTPYIPGKFPEGKTKITGVESSGKEEYGPFKFRTTAVRMVEAWERITDETGKQKWQRMTDKNGNPVLVPDSGLLLHGGGYTQGGEKNYSPLGNNRVDDNTIGCIRIPNQDASKIKDTVTDYIKKRGPIDLEVKK
jgi:hypothetical protein